MLYWLLPGSYLPFLLFVGVALTDALDGYLARRWQVQSEFGAFLDPVADKLLVVSLLLTLAIERNDVWFTVPAIVIICRELIMSMLREWMALIGAAKQVAVSNVGKYKTAFQMSSLGLFLLPTDEAEGLAFILLYGAKILTCYSLYTYLKHFPLKKPFPFKNQII
jgi:CDP-diacylglycerol--glycerol-3-phosphate 3-phosphatidyltransferase